MPKILLAIVNAQHRAAWRELIRNSWLPQVPRDRADAFFFCGGRGSIPDSENVVQLDCPDNYERLPSKVQSIMQWADANGYDHLLKIDDDVVLRPTDFLNSGFDAHEYTGGINRVGPPGVPFGFCYTVSNRCMKLMMRAPVPIDFDDERWVAHTLSNHHIEITDVRRYVLCQCKTAPKSDLIKDWWDDHNPTANPFAWCVHMPAESQEAKLREFITLFQKHGEAPIAGTRLIVPALDPEPARAAAIPIVHRAPTTAYYRYKKDGVSVDWFDLHPRG